MDQPSVWLITGVQSSGKTTVANLLAKEFSRAVHIPGGAFYRWAVRGWSQVGKAGSPESRAHLELRYRLSAMVADEYAHAGFTAVVQDNIYGADVASWIERVRARPVHLVVLRPSVEAVEQRDADRRELTGKVAYRAGEWTVEELDAALAQTPRAGLWLDTSEQTPSETVAEILGRGSESVIAS